MAAGQVLAGRREGEGARLWECERGGERAASPGRGYRFPSSRRWLWDRTPAAPPLAVSPQVRQVDQSGNLVPIVS